MGERRGFSIGPNPTAMLDLLTMHRTRHPIADEQPLLTLVGVPPGRTAALSWTAATALLIAGLAVLGGVLAGWIGAIEGLAWFLVGFVALIPLIGEVKRIVRRRPRAHPTAVLLTSDRLLVVEGHRSGPVLVLEERAAVIDRYRIREPVTVAAQLSDKPILDLFGPGGPVLSIELPRADPEALRILVTEAGLREAEGELA